MHPQQPRQQKGFQYRPLQLLLQFAKPSSFIYYPRKKLVSMRY